MDADQAAARLLPNDTLGMPLGTGQPVGFLEALGRRSDWEELRIGGALLTVLSEVFSHPRVHYLSGFYRPLQPPLRDNRPNISFAPPRFPPLPPVFAAHPP